jgi:hypothetical protein
MNLEDLFSQVEDQPIPGGCDTCDASQTIRVVSPGVWVMDVVHEDWCTVPRAADAETN